MQMVDSFKKQAADFIYSQAPPQIDIVKLKTVPGKQLSH